MGSEQAECDNKRRAIGDKLIARLLFHKVQRVIRPVDVAASNVVTYQHLKRQESSLMFAGREAASFLLFEKSGLNFI